MAFVDRIDPDLTGLCHQAPARAVPFLVEGARHWIRGVESRPGFGIGRDVDLLASVDVPGLGTASNVLLFPGIVRRDFTSTYGSCVETVLAAPTLPLLVAEWRVGSGRLPGAVVVEVAGPGGEVVQEEPSTVVIASDDYSVGVALSPGASSWSIEGGGRDPVRVVVEPDGAGPLCLAVALGGSEEVRRGLTGARHANAHAVRAASGPEGGLILRTGVPEIDDGFLWLRSRLAGQIRRRVGHEPVDELALCGIGLAALGAGDRESAELLLSENPRPSALPTLLAARFASVFGDTRAASAMARVWLDHRTTADPPTRALTHLALGELSEALHGAADAGTLAALRRIAAYRTTSEGSSPARPSGRAGAETAERRLPMTRSGTASDGDPIGWLSRLLEGNPAAPVPSHPRPAILDVRGATARFATDPDEAWVQWRQRLAEPQEGDAPSVLWDPDHLVGGDGGGSLTAELIMAVAYGLLGMRPDAAAGRIRLAPRMPSHVTRFEAGGIPVGTSSVGLRFVKSEGLLRYELSPEIAAVPPLVVLEPSVVGKVESVRIDGESADLDLRWSGERTVTPVQFPLDGVRTLEIETTPSGAA